MYLSLGLYCHYTVRPISFENELFNTKYSATSLILNTDTKETHRSVRIIEVS